MGLSLVHFHQQAISSRLRDLRYSQTWHTELYPAGERKARGSGRVWFKQQLTALHHCPVFTSHSLARTHTYTQSEKANSATYMLTKYLHEACQVHWESSDSWLAAEDGAVWSAVAWRRAAPFAAQTMNCWHEALTVYMDMTWPWHTSASGQISLLFILLCACVGVSVSVCVWSKQHRQPNIYFRWEEKRGQFDWSWICGNVKLRCLPTVKW